MNEPEQHLTETEILDRIDARIAEALTPETLTRLALKGITPNQARNYLRMKALRGIAEYVADQDR